MRLIIFFLASVFLTSVLSAPSLAQDTDLPASAADNSEIQSEKNNVYSQASDEQIDEAQRFFRNCSDNKTMSKEKDCRCAATVYLETRIKLGNEASVDEIMATVRGNCIKDASFVPLDSDVVDMSEVTDKQLEETFAVFEDCNADVRKKNKVDCECLASKFLEERIKQGPVSSRGSIEAELTDKCRNVVEQTGFEYSKCMMHPFVMKVDIEPKDFCECYARRWADLYQNYKGPMTVEVQMAIAAKSRSYCLNHHKYE